jgi:hypothetical protein
MKIRRSVLNLLYVIYSRGDQLDQLLEPHFGRQQSAGAMYSTQKKSLNESTARF